jgi:hypothetical protein
MQQPNQPTNKPTNQPASKQADQQKGTFGVIQSLASGFDLVTRHPDLMLLPILLDVFLWLGPRLSAYPLFKSLLDFMNSPDMVEAMGSTQAQQMEALQKLLDQAGQIFNLFWWLSPTLLGVPGLMVGSSAQKIPSGQPTIWPISNGLVYFGLFFLLSLLGLGLSAVYWGMLSSRVREQALSMGRIAVLWWGLIKIAILVIGVALIIGFPTVLVTTLLMLLSPLIAQFAVVMGGTLILWVLFYLVFTVHGVALRDAPVLQSVRMSIVLMRFQFLPAMGLIILSVGIYIGTGFVWNIPASDSWIKAAGILGHAFTATGLLSATAIFYVDRTQTVVSGQ